MKPNFFVHYLLIIAFSIIHFDIQAQLEAKDYPIIGQPIPDFLLEDISYFSKKKVSLGDLRGRPFILDFFAIGCTGCFLSFSKINELQDQFNDKVQFILIGKEHDLIRPVYEKFRQKHNLRLPVVYDTVLFNKFKIDGVPHVIWVDKDGIVKAITSSTDIIQENVISLIKERDFEFEDHSFGSYEIRRSALVPEKPFLTHGNGGDDDEFLQRSLLSEWQVGMPVLSGNLDEYVRRSWPLQVLGWSLSDLYRLAYTGKMFWLVSDTSHYGNYCYSPIVEIEDDSLFRSAWQSLRRKYCYSLVTPLKKRNVEYKMKIMQRDLTNFFEYDVNIEIRKMPYLKLIATEAAKENLKTKGGPKIGDGNSLIGFSYSNIPVQFLISVISAKSGLVQKDLPLLDETGITGNIDISFEALMTDWADVKKSLQLQGLDIVKGEKKMKVIVIKDPKPMHILRENP